MYRKPAVHEDKKPWCTICKANSFPESNLKKHMKEIHHVNFAVTCKICNANFRLRVQLKKHLQSVHENIFENQFEKRSFSLFSYKHNNANFKWRYH